MTSLRHLVYALRAVRLRQLRARAVRPLRRRRFPHPSGAGPFAPVDDRLWRSEAFASTESVAAEGAVVLLGKEFAFPPPDWQLAGEPRLRRFHLHYGDEVLGWTRRGDVASAQAAIAAWIEGNPPRPTDAWHPYPLSTRVGNWIAAMSLAPELATAPAMESLRRQLAHLSGTVEDDVLGNHLIRNARALVLGGRALDRADLVDRGLAVLRRELPEQILADGGHYERSPAYHLLVLRDLLEIRAASEIDWLDGAVERMRRFAAALARPDGGPALFNDGALDFAPILELPEVGDGLQVFPETGYAVLRRDGVWLAFDFGPPCPDFLPAHAHADVLSFQLWVDGRPIVVDPGTYTYDAGAERAWFRSTAAHSTIALDGRDQFELWGAFRAGRLPRTSLQAQNPLSGTIATRGIVHRRSLRLLETELVVEDELSGSRATVVRTTLPLGADLTPEQIGTLPLTADRQWLSERMFERRPLTVIHADGRPSLPAELGWRIPLRPMSSRPERGEPRGDTVARR